MRYNPTLNKSWRCLCGEKSKPGYWSPFPAISMYSFPVRWHKLISVPRVCQIKQLGEGRCVSELQFGDTLLQRVAHFEQCDYRGLSFHRGREPMAHSPSRSSLVILHSQNQGDVSDSPGYRSLPLALFWAHMHPLPGIFLCVLHDASKPCCSFGTLSIAQKGDWSQATSDTECVLRAGVTKGHARKERVSSLDSTRYNKHQ